MRSREDLLRIRSKVVNLPICRIEYEHVLNPAFEQEWGADLKVLLFGTLADDLDDRLGNLRYRGLRLLIRDRMTEN